MSERRHKASLATLRTARPRKQAPGRTHPVMLPTDPEVSRRFGRELRASMRLDLNGLATFQCLNKIKEIELRRKVADGGRVRVAFFLDSIAKFTGANVYRAMRENPLFEPFVALYSLEETCLTDDVYWRKWQQECRTLTDMGYEVFPGYDANRHYIPLELYRPDIVFVSPFYLDPCAIHCTNTLMNINFLVCQLNYGFNICNSYEYHYNNRRINTAWKYFVSLYDDFRELTHYSLHYGVNAVFAGSPRMDDYAKPLEQCSLPAKIDNGRPIVIYAPHWTIRFHVNVHDLGTFDLYHEYFLNMVRQNPDVNFVFKPHPSLESAVVSKGVMSLERYRAYVAEWDSLPNGLHVFDGDYIDLFRKSSLLITDSASFILEWLPSGHPCLYLGNPRRTEADFLAGFEPPARRVLRRYSLCWNTTEIDACFARLLRDGNDPQREARAALTRELFPNLGRAARSIVNYLEILLDKAPPYPVSAD